MLINLLSNALKFTDKIYLVMLEPLYQDAFTFVEKSRMSSSSRMIEKTNHANTGSLFGSRIPQTQKNTLRPKHSHPTTFYTRQLQLSIATKLRRRDLTHKVTIVTSPANC